MLSKNLLINNKKIELQVPTTLLESLKGLSNKSSIKAKEGMLIPSNNITMEKTKMPLLLVGVKNNEVVSTQIAKPKNNYNTGIVDYTLELSPKLKNKIKVKDKVQMSKEGSKLSEDKLYVLDEKGDIQKELEGNARIFSRVDTNKLFMLAKKGNKLALGEYFYKATKKQMKREENNEFDYATIE